jgi:LCP family protein required for cell wall assembly
MSTPPPPFEPPFSTTGTATAAPERVPEMGKSRRKRRRRRGVWLRRAAALAILAVLLAAGGVGAGTLLRMYVPHAPLNLGGAAPGEPINILVIGVDPTPVPVEDADKAVRRLADTIMVLSLNYQNKRAFVLSIPRDTRATLGQGGDGALGDALALGGIPLVKDTVEELTGLTIHHYIWVDLDGAKNIVKELGNTEEYLPKPLKFADAPTGLSLDLPAGWHDLTPQQTLAYEFHREPGQDLERIARQQMILGQWQQKIAAPLAAFWFPSAVKHALGEITTDIPKPDFESLAAEWRHVDPHSLTFALLPGEVSPKGEWLMSPARWEALLPRLQASPGTKPVVDVKPTLEIVYSDPAGDKVMTLADTLTKQGFQVLRTTAQADLSVDETILVDRTRADERSAIALQTIDSAVKGARVVIDPGDTNGYGAQYTLKLGKGFFR